MAPRRAPLTEQIERRISDPLCGAGGGFPLRQREYTFSRRLPSGQVTLLGSPRALRPGSFPDHNAVLLRPTRPPLRVVDWSDDVRFGSGPTKSKARLILGSGRSLLRERRTEAVHQLPKLRTRVRFPSLALIVPEGRG